MLSQATLLSLWRSMLRARMVDEAIAEYYAQQEMRCPVHLSVGQEAVAVGVCQALDVADKIVCSHRCHAPYLAKGGDLKAMLAEIYGKVTGCCGGRGGSMHLFDNAAGVLASIPIVGSMIPLAVGAALKFKQCGDNHRAVAFLGDAAIEEGVAHESFNFAAVHNLPIIFVIENNFYSVYTPLHQRQPEREIMDVGRAYNMPVLRADGNDVSQVYQTTHTALDKLSQGPVMLSFDTYRWREHCGPNYDNDLGYRDVSEFEHWRKLDPITKIYAELELQGAMNADLQQSISDEIATEIESAFDFAKKSAFPDALTASQHVYHA